MLLLEENEPMKQLTEERRTHAPVNAPQDVAPSDQTPSPTTRVSPREGLLERLQHLPYKWVALSVTTLGVLMAAIDSTIVILAVPQMMERLHSDLVTMVWVIMGYLLMNTVFLLTFGRIADMLGRVRMYNLGFVVFTFGSALCSISQSGEQLIVARLIQGAGGAMLAVNSMAIVTEAFPKAELGRAMGLNAVTFAVGGIVGPVLGGLILTFASWRWVFFLNVPVGIAGTVWAYLKLRELSRHAGRERFDPVGAVSFSMALLAVLFGLTDGIELGWTSMPILALFGACIGFIAFFIWWERRSSNPVLDFRLFKDRVYNFSVIAAMLQSLALYAVNFIVVFYLQAIRGYSPLTAALLLIPLPLASSTVAPFSGILSDRVGAPVPATAGLVIQILSLLWLTALGLASPYWQVAVGLALLGLGAGMFWSPNTSAAMKAAPTDRLGVASATLATLRNSGMVTSFALVLAVTAGGMPPDAMMAVFLGSDVSLPTSATSAFVNGMHHAFILSAVICAGAALASSIRGRETRRQALHSPAD
jgi:EmrB/QacA subfamily drug resistance transporter